MSVAGTTAAGRAESIAVHFFGSLREAVGEQTLTVELAEATVGGLKARLREQLPAAVQAAVFAPGVQVAVNQELVADDVAVAAGDEVALLPPVTGG